VITYANDEAQLSETDADLGSSGPLLLPDQPGSILMSCYNRKGSNIYVIDRDRMGKFQRDHDAIVQKVRWPECYGAMAY